VAAQFGDESRDSFASSVGFVAVVSGAAVEAGGEIGVSEAVHSVLAGQGCFEEGQVDGVEGTEAGHGSPASGSGPAQGV
jgi:hypothetical protein